MNTFFSLSQVNSQQKPWQLTVARLRYLVLKNKINGFSGHEELGLGDKMEMHALELKNDSDSTVRQTSTKRHDWRFLLRKVENPMHW